MDGRADASRGAVVERQARRAGPVERQPVEEGDEAIDAEAAAQAEAAEAVHAHATGDVQADEPTATIEASNRLVHNSNVAKLGQPILTGERRCIRAKNKTLKELVEIASELFELAPVGV